MKGVAQIVWIVGILAVLLIASQSDILPGSILPTADLLCQDIFCNDFEFQCCGLQRTSQNVRFNIAYGLPPIIPNVPFICGAEQCIITQGEVNSYEINGVRTTVTYPFTVNKGDIVNLPQQDNIPGDSTILYDAYNQRLAWCGDAACDPAVTGITVSGADGCSFATDSNIYNIFGQLETDTPTNDQVSYTVPVGECKLIKSTRFVCGNTCEECNNDADCAAGHTYIVDGLGAECRTGELQKYGCVDFGTSPGEFDLDILPNEDPTIPGSGQRCEVTQREFVQCCPGTATCGSNAFCDSNTFTCEASGTIECTADYQCGTAPVYDQPTKTLRTPVCVNNLCTFTERQIGCFYNSECPEGWFCDNDYTCKESTIPKTSCPNVCCVGDSRYFDRECPFGFLCCPGGQECVETLDQCIGDCIPEFGFIGVGQLCCTPLEPQQTPLGVMCMTPDDDFNFVRILSFFLAAFVIILVVLGALWLLTPLKVVLNPKTMLLAALVLAALVTLIFGGIL